jgi:hypothetical protein
MNENAVVGRDQASLFAAFDTLMKVPLELLGRASRGESITPAVRLMAGSVACWGVYGAAAGFFQPGTQIVLAGLKAPVIVAGSIALCAPSLYVFASLAGADLSGRRFIAVIASFIGMLGLLLAGLMPIAWLFSVSSRSLAFVVWFHLAAWLIALFFAGRVLSSALRESGARSGLGAWLLLFCIVSFQVTTVLRPVLWRTHGGRLLETERVFFLEHFAWALDH